MSIKHGNGELAMESTNYAIIRGTKYANAPAVLDIPRGVTQEISAPMRDNRTPIKKLNPSQRDHNRLPQYDCANDCYSLALTRNKQALIDAEDIQVVGAHVWMAMFNGGKWYAVRYEERNSKRIVKYLHRELMNPGRGLEVDHINGDSLDNRRANLRVCTRAQNGRNTKRSSRNKSGYVGVNFDASRDKWRSTIRLNGKSIQIGRFLCPIEAAIARDIAALELHGEFASLNFPELREVFGYIPAPVGYVEVQG